MEASEHLLQHNVQHTVVGKKSFNHGFTDYKSNARLF